LTQWALGLVLQVEINRQERTRRQKAPQLQKQRRLTDATLAK
jgi:hypothetical protein